MRARGRNRYYKGILTAETSDRGSETSYAQRLIPEYFLPLIGEIKKIIDSPRIGTAGKFKKLIQGCSPEQCSFFTLQIMFNYIMQDKPLTGIVIEIGKRIEDEQKFVKFRERAPVSMDRILKRLHEANTHSHSHRVSALSAVMAKAGVEWVSWTTTERLRVGMLMFQAVKRCSNIIDINTIRRGTKTTLYISPSQECLEWITTHTEAMSVLHPEFTPTIIIPKEWTGPSSGGYYLKDIQDRVTLVKTRHKTHGKMLDNADLSKVYSAVNAIQSTGYTINRRVLEVMQEAWKRNARIDMPHSAQYKVIHCPIQKNSREELTQEELGIFLEWKEEARATHTLEKTRASKCLQLSRILKSGVSLKEYSCFFFPSTLDFRGRVYSCTQGLSPQGSGPAKGLLNFHESKPVLSDEAMQWYLIHGANTYGFDKLSFNDRIKNITEMHDVVLDIAKDPLGTKDFWKDTESPWQFLGWCFEYSDIHTKGSRVSSLPVFLDGSCNGLQHFSALLLDSTGAVATNLVNSPIPQDIYARVAEVVETKLKMMSDQLALRWIEFKITRSLTKRPVMTLPYGATKRNCLFCILDSIVETDRYFFPCGPFKAAKFLADVVWESIEETVQAATTAMAWLKDVARAYARAGQPVTWNTPVGLPVYHAAYKTDTYTVLTAMDGRKFNLQLGEYTDKLSTYKMVNGISPNFVHSLDASHLMMTVNDVHTKGVHSIACVHDSFGTHAADTGILHKSIKEQFHGLYSYNNPLQDLAGHAYDLGIDVPDIPKQGGFNIKEVLKSNYLFS